MNLLNRNTIIDITNLNKILIYIHIYRTRKGKYFYLLLYGKYYIILEIMKRSRIWKFIIYLYIIIIYLYIMR